MREMPGVHIDQNRCSHKSECAVILYPIVSFKYVYPVHTEKQREWILDYMPKLFQTNAKSQKLVWVNKPLWPELSESGQLLLADFYYNQKAAGKRTTDQIDV